MTARRPSAPRHAAPRRLWAPFVVVCLLAGGVQAAMIEDARYVMGTLAVVRIEAADPDAAAAAADAAHGVFARVDSLMSTWRADSALSALNRAPAGVWVAVGAETAHVLKRARELAADTGGAFDPTVLPLVELWGFRGGEPRPPAADQVAAALARVGWRDLDVDAAAGRARLLRGGMAVDLGGIAKGHALAAAADSLRARGVAFASLDLGGNLGFVGARDGASVAVVDPRDGLSALLHVPLQRRFVATSGQYERYVDVEGNRYGHILDPRDGWPAPGGVSVAVLADDAMTADALATAAVVLGAAGGLDLLASRPGIAGVVISVGADGGVSVLPTEGLKVRRVQ